jgi:hypothetical protein
VVEVKYWFRHVECEPWIVVPVFTIMKSSPLDRQMGTHAISSVSRTCKELVEVCLYKSQKIRNVVEKVNFESVLNSTNLPRATDPCR